MLFCMGILDKNYMETNVNFYSLLIITGLAFILPLLVSQIKRIKIPVVIAEIAAGVIVGKSGFDIIQNDLWIEFLSLFGFAYLMFLSGVEIDFSYFKNMKNERNKTGNPLLLAFVIFGLTLGLSFLFSCFLLNAGLTENRLFLTLIFSTTSLGIVVPVLKERKIINEPIGQTILMSALIADFATMLMIPIVLFLSQSEGSTNLLTSLIVFVAFGVVYFFSKRYFKIDFNDNPTFDSSELKVRAAFALVLIFVTISEIANVEIILGAFLAGILFSLIFDEFRTEIAPKLDAIGYGFLIPIFFIMVGAKLDLKSVFQVETLIAFPIFIVIVYLVKLVPSLILRKYFTWKETFSAGFLISSRLSLIIAISLVAWESRVINETTYSTFILVAIFTCIISPIMFNKIFPQSDQTQDAILFAGNNEMIISLASKISNSDQTIIFSDLGKKLENRLNSLDIDSIYWDTFEVKNFEKLKDISVKTLVAAYDTDSKNVSACNKAKQIGIQSIISIIDDPKISYDLEKQGVNTVTPMKAMYTLLNGFIKYPESFEILYGPDDDDNIDVKEIKLVSHNIIGSKLKKLHLPGDCLILMISRSGRRIVPDGDTRLERGDVLVIIGSKEYLVELEDIFF